MNGRRLRTLVEGSMAPGSKLFTWDGTDLDGRAVGSGVYFYRMQAGGVPGDAEDDVATLTTAI